MGAVLRTLDTFAKIVSDGYRRARIEGDLAYQGRPPADSWAGRHHRELEQRAEWLRQHPPQVHGDARWLSRAEAERFNEVGYRDERRMHEVLTLGEYLDVTSGEPFGLIPSPAPGHVLTIAATRAGKGAAQIVPNLLLNHCPMLVIDPKGENYAVTAKRRAEFSEVIRLDPFRVTEAHDSTAPFDRYNPLDYVSDVSEARRLAEMLLGEPIRGENRFWYDEALNLLAAMLVHLAATPGTTLGDLREKLSLPAEGFDAFIEEMMASPVDAVRTAGARFTQKHEKERGYLLSEINSTTSIWDDPRMRETVSGTDFDFAAMKTGAPMTVYVVLPFDRLRTYSAFLRLVVAQFYQAMIETPGPGRMPVICLIDEFPALGRMDEIVNALGEVAGYGVRFWLFAQSIARLQSIYDKDWEAILSQCATQCFFGVNDTVTAEWLSRTLGEETVSVEKIDYSSGSVSVGPTTGLPVPGTSFSRSHGLHSQKLMTPQSVRELLGVGTRMQIVVQSGMPPAVGILPHWYENEFLRELGREAGHALFATAKRRRTITTGRLAGPEIEPPPEGWGVVPVDIQEPAVKNTDTRARETVPGAYKAKRYPASAKATFPWLVRETAVPFEIEIPAGSDVVQHDAPPFLQIRRGSEQVTSYTPRLEVSVNASNPSWHVRFRAGRTVFDGPALWLRGSDGEIELEDSGWTFDRLALFRRACELLGHPVFNPWLDVPNPALFAEHFRVDFETGTVLGADGRPAFPSGWPDMPHWAHIAVLEPLDAFDADGMSAMALPPLEYEMTIPFRERQLGTSVWMLLEAKDERVFAVMRSDEIRAAIARGDIDLLSRMDWQPLDLSLFEPS